MLSPTVGFSPLQDAVGAAPLSERQSRLRQLVDTAGQLLPTSGPITAFAFLNTLEALEDLPFEEGVLKGARLFGCKPYLTEDSYREKLDKGRIQHSDLVQILKEEHGGLPSDVICGLATRDELRLALLEHMVQSGPVQELQWFVAETDALTTLREDVPPAMRERFLEETRRWTMRDIRNGHPHSGDEQTELQLTRQRNLVADLLEHFGRDKLESWSTSTWEAYALQTLWRICRQGVQTVEIPPPAQAFPIRHRDLLLEATGSDSDVLVHEVMIRFCAAFADQGFAHWKLPRREMGLFHAFCEVYRRPAGPPDVWMRALSAELEHQVAAGLTPLESIEESLELLGVDEIDWPDFITATMLALRGWASMIRQMEVRGDRVPLPAPEGTMVEFIAVRLVLERVALSAIARETGKDHYPLSDLREELQRELQLQPTAALEQRAFLVFQLSQILGWAPPALLRLKKEDWGTLIHELESFSGIERRRVFHLAFERRYRDQALNAISVIGQQTPRRVAQPRFQAAFCIDAREESFRRHLEEISPDVETFAAPGFYCIPMYYRGIADAHFAALCPIVVRPQYWLVEEVVYTLEEDHLRRAKTRRALGTASHQVHVGSRSIAGGALLTASLGVLASIPLVARVLFPRMTARIRKQASRFVEAPRVTRLRMERKAEQPGPSDDGIGFTVQEMANFGERVLRDIGLTQNFARLVMFLGHGSFCLNNPHMSAYDCGACSGSAGGPNARALAAMVNDPRVREILAQRGLPIPSETRFIGGLHNTCDDSVSFYDLDLLPASHISDLKAARKTLAETCARNAHERCRRFQSAPLNLSFSAAHQHVEGRSEDMAQTRPEFGNASNALCFVGRRERIRGLYMDRRAFMHSYDPTQDDVDSTILGRILAPVIPVCEGINLTYFFSYVDSRGWGSGTKLPHNVVSMQGVMDGMASDLRLGLPWQSVEIHEPMRLLFVIETTPEKLLQIMSRIPVVSRIIRNSWAQVAVLDPDSAKLQIYRNGKFEEFQPSSSDLAHAPSSWDWYRGWRDNLEFAVIDPTVSVAGTTQGGARS